MGNTLGVKCCYLLDQCFLSKPVLHILVPRDILENKKQVLWSNKPCMQMSALEMFQARYYTKGSEKSHDKETCVPLTNLVFLAFDQGERPLFIFHVTIIIVHGNGPKDTLWETAR